MLREPVYSQPLEPRRAKARSLQLDEPVVQKYFKDSGDIELNKLIQIAFGDQQPEGSITIKFEGDGVGGFTRDGSLSNPLIGELGELEGINFKPSDDAELVVFTIFKVNSDGATSDNKTLEVRFGNESPTIKVPSTLYLVQETTNFSLPVEDLNLDGIEDKQKFKEVIQLEIENRAGDGDVEAKFTKTQLKTKEDAKENKLSISVSNPDPDVDYSFKITAKDLQIDSSSSAAVPKNVTVKFIDPKITIESMLGSSVLQWSLGGSSKFEPANEKIYIGSEGIKSIKLDAIPGEKNLRIADSPKSAGNTRQFFVPQEKEFLSWDQNDFGKTVFKSENQLDLVVEPGGAKRYYLYLANDEKNPEFDVLLATLTIVPPSKELRRPVITQFKTGLLGEFKILESNPDLPVATIYGGRAPLTLKGQGATPGTKLDFYDVGANEIWGDQKPFDSYVVPSDTSASTGAWEHKVVIERGIGDKGKVYVVVNKDGELIFAEDFVHYEVAKFAEVKKPTIVGVTDKSTGDEDSNSESKTLSTNKSIAYAYVSGAIDGAEIGIFTPDSNEPLGRNNEKVSNGNANWKIRFPTARNRVIQEYVARVYQGDELLAESDIFMVNKREGGFRVESVQPKTFGTSPGISQLRVKFPAEHPLNETKLGEVNEGGELKANKHFYLTPANGDEEFLGTPTLAATAVFDNATNSVLLTVDNTKFGPDLYQLRISGSLEDIFGNKLEGVEGKPGTFYTETLGREPAKSVPTTPPIPAVARGLSGSTGPYVAYPDFVEPSDIAPNGFNPSDKVETRVARLYFYRDAHRVAQIINRKVKSYNRQSADTQQQLADQARSKAEQMTFARQSAERQAITLAQTSRQKERELRQAQNSLDQILSELTVLQRQLTRSSGEEDERRDGTSQPGAAQRAALQSSASAFGRQVNALQTEVQSLRAQETAANDLVQKAQNDERLAREEQFRREVAAAQSDPDTYAPGVPSSIDPVERVSVSVVGEGLLQLRGPLKGINLIRTAIDQLDTPVGQVRVSVHSVQLNGEKVERMEKVAQRAEQYIDQARFLTMQSAELLRKAIVYVASTKAEQAPMMHADGTQQQRDIKYLHEFFGKDFIDELRALDSEFLRTGNKLLSLHSMDTTSLASALNLMALAKNSTRQEIFQCFEHLLQTELPLAEQNFVNANQSCDCDCRSFKLFKKCSHKTPEICFLANNAVFESLKGFFNTQNVYDDTMTPLQREFIRLAQIFKSRLITELEYKQRVRERAIIEERLGNRIQELRDAKKSEDEAKIAEVKERNELLKQSQSLQVLLAKVLSEINSKLEAIGDELMKTELSGEFKNNVSEPLKNLSLGNISPSDIRVLKDAYRNPQFKKWITTVEKLRDYTTFIQQITDEKVVEESDSNAAAVLSLIAKLGSSLNNNSQPKMGDVAALQQLLTKSSDIREKAKADGQQLKQSLQNKVRTEFATLFSMLQVDSMEEFNVDDAFQEWLKIEYGLISPILAKFDIKLNDEKVGIQSAFEKLVQLNGDYRFAKLNADEKRQPLDHKKFLDMLIDDLEEKHIELLEGTRAHVANIDNYLKRVTTALDDDFNNQFYQPAFRLVRRSSGYFDVQFGQIETTSVLANNRDFAKVDPSATMEFDLPKRDLLITEGITGAKAVLDDVGALANDPTFLALASLKSGQPPSSPGFGATQGYGVVRDVLPGLNSGTSEQILAQNTNGGNRFGSNLENLIPDPAVYKFETGTGYQLRPVIQPDGQAVVFDFDYMYTTNIREPIRADEKHLGRVKRHFIHTDVQLSNFELRRVSRDKSVWEIEIQDTPYDFLFTKIKWGKT
ncbi:MAG: hypothetical protein AAGA30_04915, partial [Planctomycetota bacterium]